MLQEADAAPKIRPLPQPEPGLTAETLIERARALQPMLRAQMAEADKVGRYSEEVHEAFRKAGLYRIMQPRLFGGYQYPPEVFLRVVMEIAQGHPAAGWCFCLGGSHAYFIACHYPLEVQAELFGEDGEFRAAQVVFPGGTLTPAPGGYIANGVWPFASGIPISTHFIGGGMVMQENGPPKHTFFTVPKGQFEILPDWGNDRFMGMQASGSNSVKLDNVFVPERFTLKANMVMSSTAYPDGSPGTIGYDDPMYLGVLLGWFHCEFAAILSGTARAALEDFAEQARTKAVLGQPGVKRMSDPFVQNLYGRALGLGQSAEALMLTAIQSLAERYVVAVRDHAPVTDRETLRIWGLAREACKMACECVDLLFHNTGATAGRTDLNLQRWFRDIEMYRIHIQSQPMVPTQRGAMELGAAAHAAGPGR